MQCHFGRQGLHLGMDFEQLIAGLCEADSRMLLGQVTPAAHGRGLDERSGYCW